MPTKAEQYAQMAEKEAVQLTGSLGRSGRKRKSVVEQLRH